MTDALRITKHMIDHQATIYPTGSRRDAGIEVRARALSDHYLEIF